MSSLAAPMHVRFGLSSRSCSTIQLIVNEDKKEGKIWRNKLMVRSI